MTSEKMTGQQGQREHRQKEPGQKEPDQKGQNRKARGEVKSPVHDWTRALEEAPAQTLTIRHRNYLATRTVKQLDHLASDFIEQVGEMLDACESTTGIGGRQCGSGLNEIDFAGFADMLRDQLDDCITGPLTYHCDEFRRDSRDFF